MPTKQAEKQHDDALLNKISEVIQNQNLSTYAKIIYVTLCSGVKEGVPGIALTQNELSELTGIRSKTTIRKATDELKANLLVSVIRKGIYNVYFIL